MRMSEIPFGVTDWSEIATEVHKGDAGEAIWRVQYFGPEDNRIRVRMMDYSPGYVSDHWCAKGHVIFCLDGAMTTVLEDGRSFELRAGMSYQVADGAERHRSHTAVGARLFVVD